MRLPLMIKPWRLHIYEVRPRKDKRGVDFISDVLAFAFMIQLAT